MDEQMQLSVREVRTLLGAGNADAALLYLYLSLHGSVQEAAKALGMTPARLQLASAALRQLGLQQEAPRQPERMPEKPTYTEDDILREVGRGEQFAQLVQEAQRRLGRVLSTEEMKVLLSFSDYLALPMDVIYLLITYCIQKNRVRGVHRAPSIRTIEKEAYHWADHGIDTLEDAAAYTNQQLQLQTRIGEIRDALQLDGRRLTMAEEAYVSQWLSMGFDKPEIHFAYEKTCLNKGALVWPYMNRVLCSWHSQNLHTLAQIEAGDTGPVARRTGQKTTAPGGAEVKAAYERLLAEEK